MQLEEEVRRAGKAREILENELWKEAIASIDASLLEKMAEYHSDMVACQEIALTKKISSLFVEYFEDIRETGKMAAIQIERERNKQ